MRFRLTFTFSMLAITLATFLIVLNMKIRINADEIIYIRTNGTIDPPTASIFTKDNITYNLVNNITNSIIVERNNILIDGKGFTIKGTLTWNSQGIQLINVGNVSITNIQIQGFWTGIYSELTYNVSITNSTMVENHRGIEFGNATFAFLLENIFFNNTSAIFLRDECSNATLKENRIMDNGWNGIQIYNSQNNTITKNTIISNQRAGIVIEENSSRNIISENEITENTFGTNLGTNTKYNIIRGNHIQNNTYGIYLDGITYGSSNNIFYGNNFIENSFQVYPLISLENTWDAGFSTGGNYWSDYTERYPNATEIGSTGVWDTPYIIDSNNQDNYPLIPEFPNSVLVYITSLLLTLIVICYKQKNRR